MTGIRYVILSTTEHDEGLYSCTVINKFGSDTKYLNLYVHVDSGGNGSGSGKGGINIRVYYCSKGRTTPKSNEDARRKIRIERLTRTNLGTAWALLNQLMRQYVNKVR